MKVLVVDDSGIVRRTIVKVVEELGFRALQAENGADALAQLRKYPHEIGLVILDWNMPVMDGYEALVEIRSQHEFDETMILMATADGVDEDVRKALSAGANDYLIKPFTKEELAKRIGHLIPSLERERTGAE